MDKNGNDVLTGAGAVGPRMRSSLDGDTIAFASAGGFPGSPGAITTSYYSASREEAAGWTTRSLTPRLASPSSLLTGSTLGVSADGTKAIVGSLAALTPDAVEGDGNLYLRDIRSGTYELMATSPAATFQAVVGLGYVIADGSADYSRVVFSTPVALTPDAYDSGDPFDYHNIYEWSDHRLRLISRSPSGVPFHGSELGATSQGRQARVVSLDGERVYLGGEGALYLYESGATRLVSASPLGEPVPASFRAASVDGMKMVYSTDGTLYRYDTSTGARTELSADLDPAYANQAIYYWAASDDLEWVYFGSTRIFVPGADPTKMNLYLWHDGTVRLITAFDGVDANLTAGLATPYAGPDGDLAFSARSPLTGYDNSSAGCGMGRCAQVFVYHADDGVLSCASCPDGDEAAAGDAAVGGQTLSSAAFRYYGRAITPGGRVYFETPQALVPEDVNGKRDVYELRDGRRSLISTGRGRDDAWFADASRGGDDVFITTAQQLVPQDRDDIVDLYDVRVGGGIAAQLGGGGTVPCSDDACQAPPSATPPLAEAGSATFAGAGNAAAPRKRATVRIAAPGTARGATVRLRVQVTGGPGKVTISGAAVRTARRSVRARGSYTVRVALRPAASRALTRRGRLRSVVRVAFAAEGGPAISRRVTVMFKRAARGGR